jgi:hypothetical protein
MQQMLALDLRYVDQQSLWLDIKILWWTCPDGVDRSESFIKFMVAQGPLKGLKHGC